MAMAAAPHGAVEAANDSRIFRERILEDLRKPEGQSVVAHLETAKGRAEQPHVATAEGSAEVVSGNPLAPLGMLLLLQVLRDCSPLIVVEPTGLRRRVDEVQ
jgi:hypothetical protein